MKKIHKLLKRFLPDTYESIRLNGYRKGYSEGYSLGVNDGKIIGYKDALKKQDNNIVYIDSYGITIVGNRMLIKNQNQ